MQHNFNPAYETTFSKLVKSKLAPFHHKYFINSFPSVQIVADSEESTLSCQSQTRFSDFRAQKIKYEKLSRNTIPSSRQSERSEKK